MTDITTRALRVETGAGSTAAALVTPPAPIALYLLAHGAGAGMTHPFMQSMAELLADRGVASFRYQFPYAEAGKRRPDSPRVLEETVRAAARAAREVAPALPIIAGGKSMGGRITSQAQADDPLPGVTGLAFLGFPLHAAGKPDSRRAEHLERVRVPMLFVQGTRDSLADLDRIRRVCSALGDRATLHVVDGGDHSFKVLKRSGRTHDDALAEVADAVAAFARRVAAM